MSKLDDSRLLNATKGLEAKKSIFTKRSTYSYKGKKVNFVQAFKCKKQDFNVNFYELGWDKWIIYPKVFNAHLCTGNCRLPPFSSSGTYANRSTSSFIGSSFVASSAVKITNHAQIMSILEYKHPELNKQMTKCVSTKLKPLTVIYLGSRGQIKTKQYKDMIVEECGCR